MVEIYLMPVGGKQAREHMEGTILSKVPKERIKSFLTEREFSDIDALFPEEGVTVWGLIPGEQNTKAWNRLERGDIVIFVPSADRALVTRVVYKLKNEALAKELWNVDVEGKTYLTWSLIFFVRMETCLSLDKRALLTDILGYSKDDVLMGNRRVTDRFFEKFRSLEEFLEIYSEHKIAVEKLEEEFGEDSLKKELRNKSDFDELRRKIEESAGKAAVIEFKGKRVKRLDAVKAYVKELAGYKCESCDFTFTKKDGSKYVECAHIKPLSKSLEDLPENVAALCPNCHAMLDKGDMSARKSVLEKLQKVERIRETVEEELRKLNAH